jgi:hypothetical protein
MQNNMRNKIQQILENSQEARNSKKDMEVIIQYFEQYVCIDSEEAYIFRKLIMRANISLASISRERAHIQNTL